MRLPTSALICTVVLLVACRPAEDPQKEAPLVPLAVHESAAPDPDPARLSDPSLEIRHLRDKAQGALGKRFDILAFHDLVLEDGAIPLSQLGDKVQRWIETL